MNPFFFGSSDRPLFGVYQPVPASRDEAGVVLCYPTGSEYMRAHRAFRQLANLLNRAGVHVFRFDYSGTGDSWGAGTSGNPNLWVEDIGLAIEEFKENTGLERVSLVGLRFGGTLAALAAAGRSDILDLVLWDPVVDGRDHVAAMLARAGRSAAHPNGASDGLGTIGVGGFPLTERMRSDIRRIRLSESPVAEPQRTWLFTSSENEAWDELARAWTQAGASITHRTIPSQGDWEQGDRFGSALIPQAIIGAIVDAVSKKGQGTHA